MSSPQVKENFSPNDPPPQPKDVAISSLVIESDYRIRVRLDEAVVADYAEAIRQAEGWPFPPVKLVGQNVIDGFLRIAAAKRVLEEVGKDSPLGKKLQKVPCERSTLGEEDGDVHDWALALALSANRRHGLRRSRADKQRAVELATARWPDLSDQDIAMLTWTTHPFVGEVRGKVKGKSPHPGEGEMAKAEEAETLPPSTTQQETSDKKVDCWQVAAKTIAEARKNLHECERCHPRKNDASDVAFAKLDDFEQAVATWKECCEEQQAEEDGNG